MDDRQSQIREQAGLTESRLNEDFIEFLRKYSTPMLLIVAVAAAGFFAFKKYEQRRDTKRDLAFADYSSAIKGGEPSPDALVAIADSYQGVGAVSSQALIDAANAHFRAAIRGVKPGVELAEDGTLATAEDALTQEERDAEFAAAKTLFDRVIAANPDRDHAVFRLNAMWGLVAIAESKADFTLARQLYEQIETQENAAGREDQARLAKSRRESLSVLEKMPPLVSRKDLPPAPMSTFPPFELPPIPTVPSITDAPQPQPAPETAPTTAPETAPATAPQPETQPGTPPADAPATPAANP